MRSAIVTALNAETMQMLAIPVEGKFEDYVHFCNAGLAGDPPVPQDQRTDAAEDDSNLVRFKHVGRLPEPARSFPPHPQESPALPGRAELWKPCARFRAPVRTS